MWQVKGCPRCGGDVFIDRDHYGWYRECLQCGYMGTLDVSQLPNMPPQKRLVLPVIEPEEVAVEDREVAVEPALVK